MKNLQINKHIFKKFNVKLAYLFGSHAKGNAAKESDFDIAVLFEKDGGRTDYFDKAIYLAEELRDYFPAEIDIVALNQASSLLKYEVVAHGKPIYCEDEAERIDFEVAVTKEYIDEQYVREIYYNALKERVEKGVYK